MDSIPLNIFYLYFFLVNSYVEANKVHACTRIPTVDTRYNCSHNGLQNVPRFPNTSTSIDLSNNNISSIRNDSLSGLTSLLYLHLDNNIISYIEIGSFSQLKSLRNLSLCNNRLQKDAFENLKDLPNLYFLDIAENSYTSYPGSFAYNGNLHSLKIDVFQDFRFNDNFSTLLNLSNVYFHPRTTFAIYNDSFQEFRNSPIVELKLNFHRMVYAPIGDGFLRPFRHLKRLKVDLSYHFDIMKALKVLHGVRHTVLDVLDLSGNNWNIMRHVHLTKEDVDNLLTMCVTELNLFNNRISYFPFSKSLGSPFFRCLEKLNMASNTIVWTYFEAFNLVYFPKLRYLDLASISYRPLENYPSDFSQTPDDILQHNLGDISGKYVYPDFLQRVNLTVKGPLPLEYLDISGTSLRKEVILPLLYKLNFPNLTSVKAPSTYFALCEYDVEFETSLSFFDMSGWQCREINPKFIQRHIYLSYLNMTNSNIGHYINTNQDPLIRGLRTLEVLDLSGNGIETLVSDFFEDQKQSLRKLYLRDNKLRTIPSALMPLRRIDLVDLSNNYFTYFDKIERELLDMFKNTTFDFNGNRFLCSCIHEESLVWIQRKRNLKNLFCQDGMEMSDYIKDVRTFQINCLSEFWLDFSVVLLLLMIVTIVMVAIGYRNKAVVIYLYLMAARRIKKQRHLQDSRDNYTYDVFLSYSHLDCDWVIGSLFQYLTQELSLQVCMYQKDFIPGESIAEEILRSIDSSRKSVFVITRNFLESKWSMFEMELARQHVFMNDSDTILIILKDDIQVHELPNLLKKIWWRTVCLQFPKKDDPEELIYFWNRLSKVFNRD